MGFDNDLDDFFAFLSESDIFFEDIPIISREFIVYMNKRGHNIDEFNDDYKVNHNDYKSYEDFVYSYVMGFDKKLNNEYIQLECQSEELLSTYEKRIASISIKLRNEGDPYKKSKLEFFLSQNSRLYEKAIANSNDKVLKQETIRLCQKSKQFYSFLNFNFEFYDLNQYDDMNWRVRINFPHCPIKDMEYISRLYESDRNEYLKYFHTANNEKSLATELLNNFKYHHLLYKRYVLIQTALNYYFKEQYLIFINLVALQIEGLIEVYRNSLGLTGNTKSITDKLEKLQDKINIYGYVYYAYDFPKLRNEIAHGGIVDTNLEENAIDIFMDIYNLSEIIISAFV